MTYTKVYRAYLKNTLCQLYATICGELDPNEG